jgi:hypothetical protein
MFINTGRNFPEGAVLNLKFLLSLSGVEIQTRCEVRYCLKGVHLTRRGGRNRVMRETIESE